MLTLSLKFKIIRRQIKNIQKIYISLKGKKKFERIEIFPIRNKEKIGKNTNKGVLYISNLSIKKSLFFRSL
jgi:hypothetical protein